MSELTLEEFLNEKSNEMQRVCDSNDKKNKFVFSSTYTTRNILRHGGLSYRKENPHCIHYTLCELLHYAVINSKIYMCFYTGSNVAHFVPETHAHLAFPDFEPYCQTLRENKRSLMTVFRGLEKIQKRKQEKERQALMLDERTQRDHWYRDHPLYGLFE